MPGPNHRLCQPGDVLMFYGLNLVSAGEKVAKTLKVITVVPAVVSAVQTGAAGLVGNGSCNHAAIISRIATNKMGAASQFDMSHATDAGGIITTDIDNYFLNGGGTVKVFRCKYGGAGAAAAAVALRWAPMGYDTGSRKMSFGRGKAFLSALRSSRYGSGAKARAALYRQHRNTEGGPPNLGSGVGEMSMFCSMFVIACYQAGLSDDAVTGQVMGLDSECTSPMTLDGYMRSRTDLWEEVNALTPPG